MPINSGTVTQCDNSDDTPYEIKYEDGDSEWISLAELKTILVSTSTEPSAKRTKTEPKATATNDKVAPAQQESKGRDRAQRAATGRTGAEAATTSRPSPKPRASAAAAQPAAAAAATAAAPAGSKGTRGTPKGAASAGPSRPPAEPSSAVKAKSGGRTLSGGNTGSALHKIVETASGAAQQLYQYISSPLRTGASTQLQDGDIARFPFSDGIDMGGVSAASQMVVAGDSVYITAMPRQGERRCGVDVQIKGVLGQLTKFLSTAGTRKERLLTVRVTIADMSTSIAPFQSQWAAFASSKEVRPVLTIVEANGPYPDVKVLIEAVAAVAPNAE